MRLDELILKFIWKFKDPRIARTLLEEKVGELALLHYEANYRATVIRLCGEDARTNRQVSRHKECRGRPVRMWGAAVGQQWLRTVEKWVS